MKINKDEVTNGFVKSLKKHLSVIPAVFKRESILSKVDTRLRGYDVRSTFKTLTAFNRSIKIKDCRRSGFTLLEIMVALAIIGGLLVTVLYSLNYHLSVAGKHEFVTVATMLAKNKMSVMDQIPAATSGEFPDPYSGYHYETGIKDSAYPGISEIWVTVSKNSENVKLSELKEIATTGNTTTGK